MKTLLLTIVLVLAPYTFAYAQFCGEFFFFRNQNITNKPGDTVTVTVTPVQTVVPDPCQGDKPLTTLVITTDTIDLLGDAIQFEIAGGFNEPHVFTWVANTTNIQFFCYSEAAALKDCLMDIMIGTGSAAQPAFSPTQKNLARAKAFGFETVSGAAAVAVAACIAKLGFGNPICLGLTSIATTFAGYAKALNRIADDPPRDDFAEACVVTIETIDPLGAGTLRQQTTRLLRNGARINGTLDAAICAAEKSAGAEIAGATDWQNWQADQAQSFLHDSAPMFGRAATILQNVTKTLQARGEDVSFLDGVSDSLIELEQGFAP